MPTITVLDSTGATQTVQTIPAVGQALKAASLPVTLASDQSDTGNATTAAPTYITGSINPLSLNLAGGLRVDGSGVTQPVSLASTTLTGTSAVSLAALPALTAGAAAIGTVAINAALPTGANTIGAVTGSGNFAITAAALPLPSGAALDASVTGLSAKFGALGQAAMAASAPVTIASNQTALSVTDTRLPTALGALASAASLPVVPATDAYALLPAVSTNYLVAAAATNNLTQVKATAGAIKSIQGYNAKTSAVYLKLFGLPSASVTAGTTAAVKSLYLPATSAFVFDFPAGYAPSGGTGLSFMLTTGGALTDNTATAVNDVLALNVDYI